MSANAKGGGGTRISVIVIAVLIGIGVVWWKFSKKSDQSDQVRSQMAALVQQVPDYDTFESLYVELLETHHPSAFEAHHRIGGRFSAPAFDGELYLDELFDGMARGAESRGYEEQAAHLRQLREELVWDN